LSQPSQQLGQSRRHRITLLFGVRPSPTTLQQP